MRQACMAQPHRHDNGVVLVRDEDRLTAGTLELCHAGNHRVGRPQHFLWDMAILSRFCLSWGRQQLYRIDLCMVTPSTN